MDSERPAAGLTATVPVSMSFGPSEQRLIRVHDAAGAGEARRQAAELARMLGFDATSAGNLALAVTEAGTNIVKHTREGCILVRPFHCAGEHAVEVLALDQGQGIADIGESMRDGYSTAGSPGTGLGAIARVTEAFHIASRPGRGTALRFEVWARPGRPPKQVALPFGAVCVPRSGESACGDAWCLLAQRDRRTVLVLDGLGHGVDAAAAAHAAVDIAMRHGEGLSAAELIETVHAGMRATRGAAGAAIVLEPARERGTTCGIGNIAVSVRHAGVTRKLVSHNGILGHQCRKVQEFPFPFPPGALLVAHSDGLDTRWRLEDYPGADAMHPALVAGMLFRDHERRRDDAAVVVLRNEPGDRG